MTLAKPLAFAALLLPACTIDPSVGTTVAAIEGENALSENRLSYNRLSYNRLSYNRLSYNRLSYNRLSYNGLDNDMHLDEEGRDVLRYVAKCALNEGDVLVVSVDDVRYEFPGALGLAPEWEDGALSEAGQHAISACLLAHVNKYGVSVPISIRHDSLYTSDEERERFSVFEGAFFGNIFEPDSPLYACHAPVAFSWTQSKEPLEPSDDILRACTDEDCGSIDKLYSTCDMLCTGAENYDDCSAMWHWWRKSDTPIFANPMQVWLLDPADPDAAWKDNVELVEALIAEEEAAKSSYNTWGK